MENEDVRAVQDNEAHEERDEGTDQRAELLMAQAQAIAEAGGPNMLEVFRKEPVIREKVVRGEWDFQVAYGFLLGRESAGSTGKRSIPAAVRSPNSANTQRSVSGMSESEFDALDERLSRGEVIDPGR